MYVSQTLWCHLLLPGFLGVILPTQTQQTLRYCNSTSNIVFRPYGLWNGFFYSSLMNDHSVFTLNMERVWTYTATKQSTCAPEGLKNLCTLQKTNLLVIVSRSDGKKPDVLSPMRNSSRAAILYFRSNALCN